MRKAAETQKVSLTRLIDVTALLTTMTKTGFDGVPDVVATAAHNQPSTSDRAVVIEVT